MYRKRFLLAVLLVASIASIVAVTSHHRVTARSASAAALVPGHVSQWSAEGNANDGVGCITPPSGAVAWYPGDGNPNDIIAGHDGVLAWHTYWVDANGNGHNWVPADGQHGATFGPGIVGEAFSLDGNSFVEFEDTVNGTVGGFGREPFTIALWAKFNGACLQDVHCNESFISVDGTWTFWFEALGSPEIDNGESVVSGALHFSPIDGSGEKGPVVTFDNWIPEPDRWYQLAVTRSTDNPSCVDEFGETRTPDRYTLYIDGLQVSENVRGRDDGVCVGPIDFPNYARLLIGAETEAGSFFVGYLDEIGIWHRALSATEIQSIFNAGSYGMCKTASFTGAGQNVFVQTAGADLTFSEVTTTGTTSVVPIDPATVGQVPGGFAVSNSVAYEISTTATFNGPVTLAFKVPGPISHADFDSLVILHIVNGTLVDVTTSIPPRDYANLTIYAITESFSPFYLARREPHIKALFDQTKAFRSGSTVPIKLQVLNASNINVSSAGTFLVTRDLRLISGNTLAPIEDSGNANPDYTFRYDPTLGGAGGGYIFNLSTKGLASGQYVLSFYMGNDRSFFYAVKFEVK